MVSTGDVVLGFEIESNNARIKKIDDKWYLVFKVDYKIYGALKSWRFDDITAKNCKITIIGIKIASVCGFIEKKFREKATPLINHA